MSTTAPEVGEHVLLAIDTAIGTTVALGSRQGIHVAASDDARGHAEAIGRLLDEVFRAADLSPTQVTGVVAGIGPGPFTGLRVGIAAAHAFALGRGVPVLAVQGHAAVALDAFERGETGQLRVVQDARRRELFVTQFDGLDAAGIPVVAGGPALMARTDYAERAGDLWPERIPAASLVLLAARRLAAGRPFDDDRALYLRAPDVAQPSAPKRVST